LLRSISFLAKSMPWRRVAASGEMMLYSSGFDLGRRKTVGVEGNDLDRVEPEPLALVEQRQVLIEERLPEQQRVNPELHAITSWLSGQGRRTTS
jgi:hypothetical protein